MECGFEAHNIKQQTLKKMKKEWEEEAGEDGRNAESSSRPMYTTVGSLAHDNLALHLHPPVRRVRPQVRLFAPSPRVGDPLGPRLPQFMPQYDPTGNLKPYYTISPIQPSYDNSLQPHPSHPHSHPCSVARGFPPFTHGSLPSSPCGSLHTLALLSSPSVLPGYAPIQQNRERAVRPPDEKKTYQDDHLFFAHVKGSGADAQATSTAASLAAGSSKVPNIITSSNVRNSTSSTLKKGKTGQNRSQSYPKPHPQPRVTPFASDQHSLEATNRVVPAKAGEVPSPAPTLILPPSSFPSSHAYHQPPPPSLTNPGTSFNFPTHATRHETKNSDGNKSASYGALPPSKSVSVKDAALSGAYVVLEGPEKCSSSGKNSFKFAGSPIGHLPFTEEIELRRQANIARLLARSIVLEEAPSSSDIQEMASNMNGDFSRSTRRNPGLVPAPNWRQRPLATPATPGSVFHTSITRPQSTIGSSVPTFSGYVNAPFPLAGCSSTIGVQPQLAHNAISVPTKALISPYIPGPTSILATGPGAPQPLSAGPPGFRRMDPSFLQERTVPAGRPLQQTATVASHGSYHYGPYHPNQAYRGQAFVSISTNSGPQHGFHATMPPPNVNRVGTVTPVTTRSWTPATSIKSAKKESKPRATSGQKVSDGYVQVSAFIKPPYRLANQGKITDTQMADQVVKYYPKGLPSNFSKPERVDPVPNDWTRYYPRNPGKVGCMRQEAATDGFEYQAPKPETPKLKTCEYGAIGQERYGSGIPGTDQYWRNQEQLDMTKATSKAGWNGETPAQVAQHKAEGPPGWAHLQERRNQALSKGPLGVKTSENCVSSPGLTPTTLSPAHNGEGKMVGHKQ